MRYFRVELEPPNNTLYYIARQSQAQYIDHDMNAQNSQSVECPLEYLGEEWPCYK